MKLWIIPALLLATTPALALDECFDAQRFSRPSDMFPNYIIRPNSVEMEYKLEFAAVGEGRSLTTNAEQELLSPEVQPVVMTTMLERSGEGQPIQAKGLMLQLPVVLVPNGDEQEPAIARAYREGKKVGFRFSAAQGEMGTLFVTPETFLATQQELPIDPVAAMGVLGAMLTDGFAVDLLIDNEVYATVTDPKGFKTFYTETVLPAMQQLTAQRQQGLCQ